MAELEHYLRPLFDYWYYSLIAGVFLLFAAKFVEKLSVAIFGFIIGINILFPAIVERVPQIKEWLSNPTYYQISMVVFGVIAAAVLYAIYKSITFIFGFLVVGALGYYIANFIIGYFGITLSFEPLYLYAGVAIVLGILGGIVTYKKSAEVIGVLSILVGAGTISAVIIGFILKGDFSKIDEPLFSSVAIVIFLILVVLGFVINFKKKKE